MAAKNLNVNNYDSFSTIQCTAASFPQSVFFLKKIVCLAYTIKQNSYICTV